MTDPIEPTCCMLCKVDDEWSYYNCSQYIRLKQCSRYAAWLADEKEGKNR